MILRRVLDEVAQVFDAPSKRYTLEHMARALSTGFERTSGDGEPAVPVDAQDRERYRKTLSQFGVYVLPRTGELSIAVKRSQLSRILGVGQYARVMARHPLCVEKDKVVKPTGEVARRCLVFSATLLDGEPPI